MEDRRGSRNSDPEDGTRFVISAFLPEKEAHALQVEPRQVCLREGEGGRGWGKNEEGPDASMKSHVPSRVHRNVGRLAVSDTHVRVGGHRDSRARR